MREGVLSLLRRAAPLLAALLVACTTQVSEGSGGAGDDTAACTAETIHAADFDQTCAGDTDCVHVYEGDACGPCFCPNAPISARAKAAYDAVAPTTAAGVVCSCTYDPAPKCSGGVCVFQVP